MRKVEVNPNTHKVKGIKGLYYNQYTGRYWVRYSFEGIDMQRTFTPSNVTFSGLERRTQVELRALKKEVQKELTARYQSTPNTHKPEKKTPLEVSQNALSELVEDVYKCAVTPKTYGKIKRHLSGFALCNKPYEVETIDSYNKALLLDKLAKLTPCMQCEVWGKVSAVFKRLIVMGLHKAHNPADYVKQPQKIASVKEGVFSPYELQKIRDSITDSELRLFFELCCVTGQRPVDIHRLHLPSVKRHYRFHNGKTNRATRVSHIIPQSIVSECHNLGKWSKSQYTLQNALNAIIKDVFGANDDRTLYTVRHSFLSNLRNLGNSLDDCKLWTHAGNDAAELHYIHESQEKADKILTPYLESLGYDLAA